MEALKYLPVVFIVIAIAGIIGGASMTSLVEFGDSMTQCTSGFWNSSNDGNHYVCVNATNDAVGNTTQEFRDTLYAKDGLGSTTSQIPVISIVAVMVIIIGILAGVMAYFAFFR